MNIKKILISFTCLLLCLLFPCQSAFAADPLTVISTIVDAIQLTALLKDEYEDKMATSHETAVKAWGDALNKFVGQQSVTVANYTYIRGKNQTRYLNLDGKERSYNVDIAMYYLENPDNYMYDDTDSSPSIRGSDGLTYIANNIYFDIWYSDTTHYRIRYRPNSYLSLVNQFTYQFPSNGSVLLNIVRPSSGSFFDVSNGSKYGTLLSWGNSQVPLFLYSSDINSIVTTPLGTPYSSPATYTRFIPREDSSLPLTENMSNGYYPSPYQICFNTINFSSINFSQTSSTSYSVEVHYYGAFIDSNIKSFNDRYISMPESKKYSSVYYYDNRIVGGTTVNNENKNTVLNGVLSNSFDVSGIFTGLADINATLKPILDLALPEISAKIDDLFGEMPDFNFPWTSDRDNNYWDLPFEIPDSGGDITVIVTVDVPRPLVTTMTYTTPLPPVTLPSLTTYTLPAAVIESSDGFKSYYDVIFDETGLLPIFGFLALVGVGCSIIFKGV